MLAILLSSQTRECVLARHSFSSSPQPGRHRRRPRPERPLELFRLLRRALEVREDQRDDLEPLDAGDDPERAAAALAGVDLDAEHALEPLRPPHRHVPRYMRVSPATSR
jgi:hypothetical protein